MSHSRLIGTPGLLAVAMTASFCGVAQAGPEQTIFSAENALYGAGYEIGKADGWMDNTLRSAIRQYQSGHDELEATGDLDPKTLSALGIAAGENVSVSGNTVADRNAAMAAVGLKEKRRDSSSATRTVAVAPEPVPEPEALPEPAAEPEPAQQQVQEENTQDEPEAGFAATLASASDQNSQPEPEITEITEPAHNSPAEEPAEQPTPKPEVTASSEQAAPPESAEVTPQPAEAEPAPEDIATVEVENETENTPVEVAAVEQPAEPPQVARSSSDNATETRTVHESSGGFFSSIFDFLFGWLI